MKKLFTLIIILFIPLISYSKYWQKIDLPNGYKNNLWLDIYFLETNPDFGWVCGFGGKVLRTTDRGNSWRGTVIDSAYQLESVHFTNRNIGFASGPDGIFKSVNGGSTWFDITPDDGGRYWGNFMVDEDFGLVVGGGCTLDQEFRYTTDGGNTWNLVTKSRPNTGLTDVIILEKDGLGFATSSGEIWITYDGGRDWEFFEDSGDNLWQEEIAYANGSFLVPFAGIACQGQGINGGMRFSDDYGQTWRETNSGANMYGSFLKNDSEGWAVGVSGRILQTTDAGLNWDMKNCGIEYGDLDDIWFINDEEAFVVGDGVYKLADPTATLSKDTIINREICLNEVIYDTVWVKNYSFYSENTTLTFDGNFESTYSIVFPQTLDFTLRECDYIPIIIKIEANKTGTHIANLTLTYKPGEGSLEQNFSVYLETDILESTSRPEQNNYVIDSLYCNINKNITSIWKSESFSEYITTVTKANDDPQFNFLTDLPLYISTQGNDAHYSVTLQDTGWAEEIFYHRLTPCDTIIPVIVKAYGYSSIINSEQNIGLSTECKLPLVDSVLIRNTGNSNLNISDIYIKEQPNDISILGFFDGNIDKTIEPNNSKWLYFIYSAQIPGNHQYTMGIVNNDSTKINGDKNPYFINIAVNNDATEMSARDTIINLDPVCIGKNISKEIKIRNRGSVPAILYKPKKIKSQFTLFGIDKFPMNVEAYDSVNFTVICTPDKAGKISDTLYFETEPCNETVKVIVNGFGSEAILTAVPNNINKYMQSGISSKDTILVTSESNIDLTVTEIRLSPEPEGIEYDFTPILPFDVTPGQTFNIILDFLSENDTTYKGDLVIIAKGECNYTLTLPVDIQSQSRLVEASLNFIDFGEFICDLPDVTQIITLENKGVNNDTIVSYELIGDTDNFHLQGFDTPKVIDTTLIFYVKFNPSSEGAFNTELVIKTNEPNGQTITIPIQGEFYKSEISYLDELNTDFVQLEKCDENLHYTFRFINTGMYDDTLQITKTTDFDNFVIEKNKIHIPSKDTAYVNISVENDFNIYDIRFYDFKANVVSLLCDTLFEINIPIETIQPELTVNPQNISHNNLWINQRVNSGFELINPNNYDLQIDSIKITDNPLDINITNNLPFIINANSDDSVFYEFNATQSNININEEFRIYWSKSCDYQSIANINIQINEESYLLNIDIPDYEAEPGDKLDIEVNLLNEVENYEPNYGEFQLSFDRKLFSPDNVYVNNLNSYLPAEFEIPSYTDENDFSMIIKPKNSNFNKLFLQPNTLFKISGTVLASIPDKTDIIIDIIDIERINSVQIIKNDGSLTVSNFCAPEAILRELSPSDYVTEFSQINYNNIIFDVIAKKDINLIYSLYNIFGEKVTTAKTNISQGKAKIYIEGNNLPSGTYFLETTNGVVTNHHKLILIK